MPFLELGRKLWFMHEPAVGFVHKNLFCGIALFFFIFDATAVAQPLVLITVIWSFSLTFPLGIAGFIPLKGGVLVVIVSLLEAVMTSYSSFSAMAIFVVAADWISRKWYTAAMVPLLIYAGITFLQTETVRAHVLGLGSGWLIAVTVGFIVQWNTAQVAELEAKEQEARKAATDAKDAVYREISARLHDTVARSLVRILIINKSIEPIPEVAEEARSMQAIARTALGNVRALMDQVEPVNPDETLDEVVEQCQEMLNARKITIETLIPDGLEETWTTSQRTLVALIVREGAANVLKYAQNKTIWNLTLEVDGDALVIVMKNELSSETGAQEEHFHGGFGLKNLGFQIFAAGGKLFHWTLDNKWILTAEFPNGIRDIGVQMAGEEIA